VVAVKPEYQTPKGQVYQRQDVSITEGYRREYWTTAELYQIILLAFSNAVQFK
jgi:hypothetical protein